MYGVPHHVPHIYLKKQDSIMKKDLLLLLIASHLVTDTHYIHSTLAGIHLPYCIRTALLTIQKKMATASIPHHVQLAITQARSHDAIRDDLAMRTQKKRNALTWQELEERIAQKPTSTFLLFAFGSLIHSQHPINQPYQPNLNIPAIAFGVQRIFNMTHFNPTTSSLGLPTVGYEDEQLRLGTRLTNNITDYTNGILLKFSLQSTAYNDLKTREQKYLLQPIKVVDYQSLFEDLLFFDAYILVSPDQDPPAHTKPHVVYTHIVLSGAHTIQALGADGFLPMVLEKTYLTDEKTTLRTWITN